MMKRLFIIIFLVLTALAMAGCTTSEPTKEQNIAKSNEEVYEGVGEEKTEYADVQITEEMDSNVNDFGLNIKKSEIHLKDWDNEVNLEEMLGPPTFQNIKQLGTGADTFTGSYIKILEFDGLQIKLFSPAQNGVDFWIMSMDVSKEGYKTVGGIEIGDTVDDLKSVYPGIELALDGRTDPNNGAYEIRDEDQYNYLHFEIKDRVVSGIKIFHLIP